VALSSGTVLFFENLYGCLAFEGCARVNGLSVQGRFFAARASVHVLMFGALLANGFATWRGAIAQSGCLSCGSLLANQRRQSAIRHCTGGLSVLKAASSSWRHAINTQGTAQKHAKRHCRSKAAKWCAACPSAAVKQKRSSPGCIRVAESLQTMFIGMPRQGISHAAVKHLARF
jgi:hypothetical protein